MVGFCFVNSGFGERTVGNSCFKMAMDYEKEWNLKRQDLQQRSTSNSFLEMIMSVKRECNFKRQVSQQSWTSSYFLRSILSRTGLWSVRDEIDLKKYRQA